jgi:hypothetical protein
MRLFATPAIWNTASVADPGCFILDPGSGFDHFLIPDLDPNIFSDPGSYMKSGMQSYVFLAFYAFRSKVLVLES